MQAAQVLGWDCDQVEARGVRAQTIESNISDVTCFQLVLPAAADLNRIPSNP